MSESELDKRALSQFPSWLKTLAEDAQAVSDVVANEEIPVEVRTPLAASLNYLFKSLDLIDDGIEGLGFLDDAFILRIAAADAQSAGDLPVSLEALAAEAVLVREVLGELAGRLDSFVEGLNNAVVRGRSVSAIVEESAVRAELLEEVRAWSSRYEPPLFVFDEQGLVKLRSFLAAKLPHTS